MSNASIPNYTKSDVNLFPNPANGFVCIEATNDIRSVSVMDIEGKQLFVKVLESPSKQAILSTELLPANMYIVIVETDGGTVVTRMLKSN